MSNCQNKENDNYLKYMTAFDYYFNVFFYFNFLKAVRNNHKSDGVMFPQCEHLLE